MRKVSRICFHCLKRIQSGRCWNPWTGNIMRCCRRIWRGVHSRHQSLPSPKEKGISASSLGMAADVVANDTNLHTHKPSSTGLGRRCVIIGCSHLFAGKKIISEVYQGWPPNRSLKGKLFTDFLNHWVVAMASKIAIDFHLAAPRMHASTNSYLTHYLFCVSSSRSIHFHVEIAGTMCGLP